MLKKKSKLSIGIGIGLIFLIYQLSISFSIFLEGTKDRIPPPPLKGSLSEEQIWYEKCYKHWNKTFSKNSTTSSIECFTLYGFSLKEECFNSHTDLCQRERDSFNYLTKKFYYDYIIKEIDLNAIPLSDFNELMKANKLLSRRELKANNQISSAKYSREADTWFERSFQQNDQMKWTKKLIYNRLYSYMHDALILKDFQNTQWRRLLSILIEVSGYSAASFQLEVLGYEMNRTIPPWQDLLKIPEYHNLLATGWVDYFKGRIEWIQGNEDKAKKYLHRSIALDPKNSFFQNTLDYFRNPSKVDSTTTFSYLYSGGSDYFPTPQYKHPIVLRKADSKRSK